MTLMMSARRLALAAVWLLTAGASAQEAMYTAAATLPSPGVFVFRQQVHYWSYGADPVSGARSVDEVSADASLQYGIVRDLSLTLDVPVEVTMWRRHHDRGTTTQTSVNSIDLTFKWRLYQSDTGGVDTQRFALLGGARLRVDDQFGADPHVGAVYTQVFGRHGVNLEAHYTFNTLETPREFNLGGDGHDDALALNAAYVFRLIPDEYSGDSQSAWYLTSEINTLYEAGGDWEVRFSPGIMWEGRRWGFEIMAQIPLYQRVRDRPELDFGVGVGFRYLF